MDDLAAPSAGSADAARPAGGPAPIRQLLYRSGEAYAFRSDDMIRLLLDSRDRNRGTGVTGLLSYRRGEFLQLLEGDPADVAPLFARIAVDPRHCDLQMLHDATGTHRLFPGWTMAYADAPVLEGGQPAFSGLANDARAQALLDAADAMDPVVSAMRAFFREPAAAGWRELTA